MLTNVTGLPPASNSFTINHQTGVIIWDAPNTICNYDIDVILKQYKNVGGAYYYIGTTMQEIFTTNTCVTTLLLNETTVNNEIAVYPNPAQDNIQIALGTNKAEHIVITNVLGEVIKTIENKTDNSTLTINLGDVKKGIYFVEIFNTKEGLVSENKNKVYRKIIVQ